VKIGYGRDDYVGIARQDNRYFASTQNDQIIAMLRKQNELLREQQLTAAR
jgi:hypothetical protein